MDNQTYNPTSNESLLGTILSQQHLETSSKGGSLEEREGAGFGDLELPLLDLKLIYAGISTKVYHV